MKKILFTIILFAIILSCNMPASASGEDEIVATWRGGKITLKEFEDFALYLAFNWDANEAKKSSFEQRREILTKMVNFKLTELLADSLQLDTMKVMRESYKRKLGGVAYSRHIVADSIRKKAFSDNEIKNIYEKMRNEYFISHILINNEEKSEDDAKAKIDSLYLILKSEPSLFRPTAEKHSDDKGSAVSGGDLGWQLTPNFVPEFEEQVLNLKIGELSEPFKTEFGWHIAVVRDRRISEGLGSFEKEKGKITNFLIRKNQDKFDKAFQDFKIFLFKKYNVMTDDKLISQLYSRLRDNINNNRNISYGFDDSFRSKTIASFENGSITINDVLTNYEGTELDLLKGLTLYNIYDIIFMKNYQKLTYMAAVDLGYSEKPEVLKIVNEGMMIDHMEYFTDRYLGKPEKMNEWYSDLYRNYNLRINHLIFEKSFDDIPLSDDRK
ncbi:MAG: peptidylprolyl isomerase [Candidatus Delongbacteria bacterium]|nr:peptidylprolyl isomerase [Candidatus Delongbacteria bacterium]